MRPKPHQVVFYFKSNQWQTLHVHDAEPLFKAFKTWLEEPTGAHRFLEFDASGGANEVPDQHWLIDLDTVTSIRETKPAT